MGWTAEKDEWLRNNYSCQNITYCADHFGISKHAVMQRASRLKIKSGRFLSAAEKQYLIDNSNLPNDVLAKKLNRDNKSIRKMRYLYSETVIFSNENKLTCSEIARLVGKEKSAISKCWCRSGLKFRMVGRYKMVCIENLLEFMKNNPKKWDATKCETWYFEQYDWFQEKRKQDFDKMIEERWGKVV